MDTSHRDTVLRAYFAQRDWDTDPDALLLRHLVRDTQPVLARWPLLIDHRWVALPNRGTDGIGDLVFGDGHGHYAIVEATALPDADDRALPRRRATLRTSVRHRAIDHATAWLKAHADARSVAALTAVQDRGIVRLILEYEFRR